MQILKQCSCREYYGLISNSVKQNKMVSILSERGRIESIEPHCLPGTVLCMVFNPEQSVFNPE